MYCTVYCVKLGLFQQRPETKEMENEVDYLGVLNRIFGECKDAYLFKKDFVICEEIDGCFGGSVCGEMHKMG